LGLPRLSVIIFDSSTPFNAKQIGIFILKAAYLNLFDFSILDELFPHSTYSRILKANLGWEST